MDRERGATTNRERNPASETQEGRQGQDFADRERSVQSAQEGRRTSVPARHEPHLPYRSTMSPLALVRRMADDMDRLFEDFALGRTGLGFGSRTGSLADELWADGSRIARPAWVPQLETFRRGDKLVVRADLPGLKKDDVKVEVFDNMLTISGERKDEHTEERDDYYRSERSYGEFHRSLQLPEGVDAGQVEATFSDGVLEVTLPAPKEAQRSRKRIEVR